VPNHDTFNYKQIANAQRLTGAEWLHPVDYVAYSAIVDRPTLRWPRNERIAVWICLNVEFYEFLPPPNPFRQAWPRLSASADPALYSSRDYGNRVGFWRMLNVFDDLDVPVTVALNLKVFDRFPEVAAAILERDWCIVSHGLTNTQYLFGLTENEERELLETNRAIVMRETGRSLKGLFGPAGSVTSNTMRLMGEVGFDYSADWCLDDQPFPILVPTGRLAAVPYSWEINDGQVIRYGLGRYDASYFYQICKDQFDTLYQEGTSSGRVMCVALHPYIMGHPHRVGFLRTLLEYILSHERVWLTTSDSISDYYLAEYYERDRRLGEELLGVQG
jgi:allantoinase